MNFRRAAYVRNPFTPRPGYWGCMICELDMPHSSRVPHLKGKRHTLRLQVLGLNRPVETVVNPPDIPDRVEMVEKWVGGVVAENGEGGGVGEVEGGGDSEGDDDSEEDDSEESEDDDEVEDEDEDEYEEAHEGKWNDAEEHLIDLGPPNDIPDWPEISNQTSSSMSWRCTTCDETMSIFFRDQHLSGKSHANALRKGVQTQDSEVTPEPIIPSSMMWHCTICDETMGIFYKDEHLSGKHHVKKLQARGLSQDPADSIDVPETASSTYWVPDERDTEVNGVNDSLDHVVGGFSPGHQTAKRHRTYAEVLRLRATSNNKAHYTSRPASAGEIPPHIAGASTRGLGPGLHNQDEKDVKKSDDWTINNLVWSQIAKWTCMTCSMTMEMSEKEAHLDSTSHIARCNCPACTRYKSRASKESHITDTKDTEEVPAETQPLELKAESGGSQHLDEPELYPGEKTKIYPKPKPGMFHCRICDDEFILEYKWMHLSKAWECKTCDKWIHVDWRDRHIERHAIQSEKIKAREAAAEAPAAILAPDEPLAPPAASVSVKEEYYCPVCKKNLTMKQKTRHQWGAWQCMDCDLTVHILSGNRDMVCRRGARKSHGQEQKHETQFLRDLGLKEEDTKPSELIDLLGDDIDISIQEFSPMSEVGNQSFDDSLWGLMLGEGGAATYSGDVDLLEVFGLESKTEDQPQITTTNAPVVETPLGNEAAHEKKSTLQKTDEIKDIEPSDEKEEAFEASHSDAEPEGQLQNTNVCAPSVVDVPDFELTHGCQNHLPECAEELAEVETKQPLDEQDDVSSETSSSIAESEELEGMGGRPPTFEGSPAYEDSLRSEGGLSQLTEEIGDAQSSHKQAEISPEAPSPALETFHCTVCEVDLSIEKKKYHHGRAWECQVCDKKMHRSSRDSHLAGAKHRKHELLGSKKSLVATQLKAAAAVPVIPEVPVAPGIPVIPVAQARKVSETQSEPPTATDPETFFCGTCNKVFKMKIKKIHQTREWECTVCDIKTHIAWKMSHLAGSKHVRREEKALLANAVADSGGSV